MGNDNWWQEGMQGRALGFAEAAEALFAQTQDMKSRDVDHEVRRTVAEEAQAAALTSIAFSLIART